jgi:hypothetical protein
VFIWCCEPPSLFFRAFTEIRFGGCVLIRGTASVPLMLSTILALRLHGLAHKRIRALAVLQVQEARRP